MHTFKWPVLTKCNWWLWQANWIILWTSVTLSSTYYLALIQAVFHNSDCFWTWENWHTQNLKTIFFQDKFYSLKAHVHSHMKLLNLVFLLTLHSQTYNNVAKTSTHYYIYIYIYIYIHSTDLQLLFMSAWSQSWWHFFVLLLPPLPKKNFLRYPLIIHQLCRWKLNNAGSLWKL